MRLLDSWPFGFVGGGDARGGACFFMCVERVQDVWRGAWGW